MIGKLLATLSRLTAIPGGDIYSAGDDEVLARKLAWVIREHFEIETNKQRMADYCRRLELWRTYATPPKLPLPRPSASVPPVKRARVFHLGKLRHA